MWFRGGLVGGPIDSADLPSVYLGNHPQGGTMFQPAERSTEEFVYDPNHPMNVEDRKHDPDDGIDYDEIIMATEADFRAGRGYQFDTIEEFREWFHKLWDDALARARRAQANDDA